MTKRAEHMRALGVELSALLVASRAIMAAAAERFHPGLQPAAYQVAVTLSVHGPANGSQLADLLDMDKSAISRLGKSLCDSGLAQSSVDDEDRRGIIFRLTDEGRIQVEAASAVKAAAFFSRLAAWSDEELVQFAGFLRRFSSDG